jgi:pimeloyl-ACP methyl ester carboxylesterase
MKFVKTDVLEIGYLEAGPSNGEPVILLHGFPYDAHAYDQVMSSLSERGFRCLAPFLRGYGPTRFLSDQTLRSGQQAALAADLLAFMDAMAIPTSLLAGYDWGGRAAAIVAALWPERVQGLVSCGRLYNIQSISNALRSAPPHEEQKLWYVYYLNTERGRVGLLENRRAFCRHIWSTWSPTWSFDTATYERTAASFDNPDFVAVVCHSYRHRLGCVPGDPLYERIEARAANRPEITVPTIVLQGNDDTLNPPLVSDTDRGQYTGAFERRIIDGAGHNVPQEDPEAFTAALLAL